MRRSLVSDFYVTRQRVCREPFSKKIELRATKWKKLWMIWSILSGMMIAWLNTLSRILSVNLVSFSTLKYNTKTFYSLLCLEKRVYQLRDSQNFLINLDNTKEIFCRKVMSLINQILTMRLNSVFNVCIKWILL